MAEEAGQMPTRIWGCTNRSRDGCMAANVTSFSVSPRRRLDPCNMLDMPVGIDECITVEEA